MIFNILQFPNFNPAVFTLPSFELFGSEWGPFPLRWYALAYIAGLLLGWRYMVWLIRKDRLWAPGKPAMSVPQADDFLFWATLGVILGGRLGYVVFYKPDILWKTPMEIFQIWNGGMSFHGGLIGVALAAFFFTHRLVFSPKFSVQPKLHIDDAQFTALAKKRAVAEPPADKRGEFQRVSNIGWLRKSDVAEIEGKTRTATINLLRLGDLAAAATPIGLFFGRIANFINGELWGRPSNAPWAMVFPNAGIEARHPSQIYEAILEGLVLFVIVNVATLKYDSLKKPGLNTGLFLVFYGLARFLLEFVREPDNHMPEALKGYITMGMLLSLPMIAIGLWLIRRALGLGKTAAA